MGFHIISKARNISVVWKIIWVYCIILIIPFGIASYHVYTMSVNQVYDQTSKMMDQSLLQARESILRNVKIAESIAKTISYDKKFNEFLSSDFKATGQDLIDFNNSIMPFLKTISSLNPSFYSIWVYSVNETIPSSWEFSYGIEDITKYIPGKKELEAEKRFYWWNKVHGNYLENHHRFLSGQKESEINVFSFNYKIYSHYGRKLVGIVQIQIKVSDMLKPLEAIWDEKLTGKFFVADDEGTIVSGSDRQSVNRNLKEIYHEPDILEKCKKQTMAKIDGIDCIIGSIRLEELGYNIVSVLQVSSVSDKTSRMRTIFFIIILSAFAVLFIIVFIAGRKLLKRVKILLKAMNEIKKENFDITVNPGPLDEFGRLIENFNAMIKRIKSLITNIYEARIKEKEAEYKALEAQINPHFLYNTLASISCLAKSHSDPEVSGMILTLARFYRSTLNSGNLLVPVKGEIEHLSSYITLQKIRFKDVFDTVYEIDENIYHYTIIKMILQPLVENALSHGIEPKMSHGTIIIKAKIEGGLLLFEIVDDGVGMTREKADAILQNGLERRESSGGYGLKNVNDRLKIFYGDGFGISIFSKIGIGTSISVRIPLYTEHGK